MSAEKAGQGNTDTGKTGEEAPKPGAKPGDGETGKGGAVPAVDAAKPGAGDGSGKPADDKGGKAKPAEGEAGAGDGHPKAPDKYELTLPEGSETFLDEADLKRIEKLARAKGLTNDQAQEVLEEQADALADESARYRAETIADPDYGGDKLEETQRLANKALDAIRPKGTPRGDALRKELAKTGYGNSVMWVSMLADIGKMMDEDRPAGGKLGGGGEKSTADLFYDQTKG